MFKKARIKLSLTYIAILATITLSFSAFVYRGVAISAERALIAHEQKMLSKFRGTEGYEQFKREMDNRGIEPPISEEAINEIKERLLVQLALANLAILGIAGLLSYYFAGKTLEPIQTIMEKQKRFISDASHELKTPLTALKSSIEVTLRDKKLNKEKAVETLQDSITEVDELATLVNSLLEESKYQESFEDSWKLKYQNNIVLNELIKEELIKLKPLADERKVSLNSNLENVKIKGSEGEIKRAVGEVIKNAIKYNKENGGVDVNLSEHANYAVIKISDTGVGIKNENVSKIFDRFYQEDPSRNEQTSKGHGLGLSIVKDIVDKHKGTITVSSVKDEGNEFVIKLPKN